MGLALSPLLPSPCINVVIENVVAFTTEVGVGVGMLVGVGVGAFVGVAVGAEPTLMNTDRDIDPPGPVHKSENVLLDVNAPDDSVPEVLLVPVQALEAVQEVVLVDVQVRGVEPL